MSQFVEECLREWKRLRVPDPVANEMAADLAADLEEAEAEGASAEDVLGSGAFDPRSFAASWAAERGVIQPPPVKRNRLPRRARVVGAIAAFAVILAVGAALVILAPPSGPTRVAIAAPVPLQVPLPRVHIRLPERPLPFLAIPRRVGFAVENSRDAYLHRIGWTLVLVGLVGLVLSILYWSPWARPISWSRRRTDVNEPGDRGYD